MKRLLYLFLLMSSPAAAFQDGGAFGITMGQRLDTLAVKAPIQGIAYTLQSVPKPNLEFESYMVFATRETGVCKVVGIGKTYRNDSYGTSASASFRDFREILNRKYGSSKEYDFLKSGSIWKDPRDYHMSILKKERTRSSYWAKDNGSTLPPYLSMIGLHVKAVESGPYISLVYEFANFDRCQAIQDEKDNSGL